MKLFLQTLRMITLTVIIIANSISAQNTLLSGSNIQTNPEINEWGLIKTEIQDNFQCGDPFIDPRDGQSYPTVLIGEQCWMAKNLNFGTIIPLNSIMTNNGIAEKHCYNDDPANCDAFGGLYQWDEMMQYTLTSGIKGLCPEGWHVPTDNDWCLLELTVDPTINCNSIFWRGTDGGTKLKAGGSSGFEGLLGGYIFSNMSSMQLNEFAYFWTSDFYSDAWSYYRGLGATQTGVRRYYTSKHNSQSVRCIKGEGAVNLPPEQPSNPTPPNGAVNQSVGTQLMWECSDPEGDPIKYDVYLGTSATPTIATENITGNTFNPGALQYSTTYYWKIVAKDSQGNTTEGPVWNFTTQSQSGLFTCGQVFTDSRDGQQYNTKKIGEQCWMTENMNIGQMIDASIPMSNNEVIEKYCYNNNPENCETYGGLYTWDEMMQYSTSQGAQGICPTGWRLATDNEWKELEGNSDSQYPVGDPIWDETGWRGSDVGGQLKEMGTTHWASPNTGGNNNSGFSALPNGYASGNSFNYLGQMGWFWTSTQTGSDAFVRMLHYALTTSNRDDYSKSLAIGVRCIQSTQAQNEPPATPSNPNPTNSSTGIPINQTLSWTCTDPDGDPLTYDVYFGTTANPELVAEGISENTFNPGTLDYYTQYFWKIVAHDDHNNSKEGPVWNFTTTQLFFSVTFNVQDEAGNPLQNAEITLNGVTNPAGNYLFTQIPAGTFDYIVALQNYVTTPGEVTVIDQNVSVSVTMPLLVIVEDFPFVEDFAGGELPNGWRNEKVSGNYNWEFALTPFPHTFIHNIGRPQVNARLITPLFDATDLGQVTLGLNHRFSLDGVGGSISILVSEDNLSWMMVKQYTASIGSGDDFEYIEYQLNEFAGKEFFVALYADFPDTEASYEAVWEVESVTVFQPDYSVTFTIEDQSGNAINNATITLNGLTNPEGDYVFENILAGNYSYLVRANDFMDSYGFVTVTNENVTVMVTMSDALIINEFPYFKDFEENVLPEGWNNIVLGDTAGYWKFLSGQAQIQSGWGNRTHTRLVTPAFDCSELEAVALGLNHYYMDIYGVGFAEIQISTDGVTWVTVAHFQGEQIGNSDFPYFEYYITELAAGQEKVFIGFLYDDLASTEFWWLIDAFRIFEPQPYEFSLTNLSGNKYVNEGDSFTYEFQIVNMGSENDTYDLEILNASWNYELSNTSIAVNSTEVALVTVTVYVPEEIEMGEKEELILKVSSQGDETLNRKLSFTTVGVSTIKSYYFEDFDLAQVPSLPGGWSKIQQSSASWARVETQKNTSIEPPSLPNNVEFNNSSDLNANLVLISPKIDESVDLNDFRVLFKLRTGANSGIKLGTMNSPAGTFTELATFSTPEHFTWEYFMYSFEDYQGTDRYIAFKMNIFESHSGAYLDDVTVEIIPPPILKATPESHDFGEYWMNYPSEVPLALDLRNVGHDFLTINSILLDNRDDFIIEIQNGLPANLYWNQTVPVDVYFNASTAGPITGNIVVEYNDGTAKTMTIPLSGIGIPRPPGSYCDNPIPLELPVVDYENTTEFAGNDYSNYSVYPWAGLLGGYDMDFSFTLEEESYLNATISGPYYGPSLYIVDRCPDENNPAPLYARIEKVNGGSFENVILPAGDYLAIVSSPAAANPYTYFTTFVLNMSATPTPEKHHVVFNLYEDSPDQTPVADASISITGFQTDLSLTTNVIGQVEQELYEYEYHVTIYKQDYEMHDFIFIPTSDTIVDIPMNDLIWTPFGLDVQTTGLFPGQAHFTWIPKPMGEPWNESFESDYPPAGWDTIVSNNGQVLEPGIDWKFTWQKYGTVYFSDATATPVDGSYQAFVMWGTDYQDEWLITHEFEAPAGELEFWYFGKNGDSFSDYFVKVSTDNGQTWTTLWNASNLPLGRNNYDYPALIDLQPWAGQNIRIAWHAYGEYGLVAAWCIDKISVGDLRIKTEDLIYQSNSVEPENIRLLGTIPSARDEKLVPKVKLEDMGYSHSDTRVNKGFSIYLDDLQNPVAQGVQEPEFMFIGLDAGNYVAGVQAVTTTGQSEIVTIPFTNPVGGVLQNINYSVLDNLGVAVTGAEINIYYADVLLQTLQTTAGSASTQLYAGEYDFTVFKDGFKTHYGSLSVTNSSVSVNIFLEPGFQVLFSVMNLDGAPVENASVYCDGAVQITNSSGQTTFELDAGYYPYAITHPLYTRVLSSVDVQASTTENVEMFPLSCEAPLNLTGQLIDNTAVLQWDEPVIGSGGQWIHWDRDHGNNSIGTNGAFDFQVAQRFATDDLQGLEGKFLTRIWFVPHESNCNYSIRVWAGGSIAGPAELLVDQAVVNPLISEWNEIFLITPVPIDVGKELWFGYRANASTGYPAGVDVGPAENGKGNMILVPGGNWQTLLQVNPSLDYNWSVRGLVENMDIRIPQPEPILEENVQPMVGKLMITNNQPDNSLYSPRVLLGYNVYRDDVQINTLTVPVTSYIDQQIPFGTSNYKVTSVWSNGCESKKSNIATINNLCQHYLLSQGWNSLSSFIIPQILPVEELFQPIVQNLTIMQNLNEIFWPSQGINTIDDFDNTSGYVLKMAIPTEFEICGNEMANRTLSISSGWYYLPVLSECEVDIAGLLGNSLEDVLIIQELIGTRVFWPAMGIYSLQTLQPGKAYLINALNPIQIVFPACVRKNYTFTLPQDNYLSTVWGQINMTPRSQQVVFLPSAISAFQTGDIIGAFGQDNRPFGVVEITTKESNLAITLFGNDRTSADQNGFTEGQTVHYKLYRPSTEQEFDLKAEYDYSFDNTTGNYYSGSFSGISKTSLNPSEVNDLVSSSVIMFPNPAKESVTFKFENNKQEKAEIEVFNSKGQIVGKLTLNDQIQYNTKSLTAGVYFVRINSQDFSEVRKLIIK